MRKNIEFRLGVWVIKGPGNQILDSDENPRSRIIVKKIFPAVSLARGKIRATQILSEESEVNNWFNRDPIDVWDVRRQRWYLWEPNKKTNMSWYGEDTQYYIKHFQTGVEGDNYLYLTRVTPGNPKYRDYLSATLSWKPKENNDE